MVKSGKSFAKIGSRLQIALFFLFYQNFQHPTTPPPTTPPAYSNPNFMVLSIEQTISYVKIKCFI